MARHATHAHAGRRIRAFSYGRSLRNMTLHPRLPRFSKNVFFPCEMQHRLFSSRRREAHIPLVLINTYLLLKKRFDKALIPPKEYPDFGNPICHPVKLESPYTLLCHEHHQLGPGRWSAVNRASEATPQGLGCCL